MKEKVKTLGTLSTTGNFLFLCYKFETFQRRAVFLNMNFEHACRITHNRYPLLRYYSNFLHFWKPKDNICLLIRFELTNILIPEQTWCDFALLNYRGYLNPADKHTYTLRKNNSLKLFITTIQAFLNTISKKMRKKK